MKKRINKEIIIVAIISILFLMMSIVYADYLYNSNQVSFNNNNTTLTSTDVQSAIDELYNKCSNIPSVGTCPEGYECTQLNRVTYNANGGTFTGGKATNDVYYNVVEGDPIEKISKTSNVDDEGNKTGYMPQASSGITDTVTIEGADSLEVTITYQTRSSSYSWVTVNNGSTTPTTSNYSSSVSGKLYGTTKTTKTYTITGDTVKFFFYNSYSQTSSYSNYLGYYAKVKGKKNNEYIKNITITKEEGEYAEPTNSNDELTFAGWTVNEDGSGTVYTSEEEVKNMLDTENREVVLYAKYFVPTCKRATTLHTETCSNGSSSINYYCYADGYYSGGSQNTTTITYGSLGTSGSEPSPGDAFDCDVTGNGDWERFYYVSNYFDTSTQSFDNDYYVFIYYSNTTSGTASTDNVAWVSSGSTSYGPTTAMAQLPKTTGTNAWRDDLLKTRTRNILGGSSGSSLTTTYKSNFSYEGYAARLLTAQELQQGCNITIGNYTIGELSTKCKYLMERTKYSTSSYATDGPWLESAYSSGSVWSVTSYRRYVTSTSASGSSSYGARPVIEIPKSDISY